MLGGLLQQALCTTDSGDVLLHVRVHAREPFIGAVEAVKIGEKHHDIAGRQLMLERLQAADRQHAGL